jgi:hypothetical protein
MGHPTLILIWLGTLLLVLITSFSVLLSFDRLLRVQFAESHAEWEREGYPQGFFWFPRGSEPVSGTYARRVLVADWARSRPDWVSVSGRARSAYAIYKGARVIALMARYIFYAEIIGIIILGIAEGNIGR